LIGNSLETQSYVFIHNIVLPNSLTANNSLQNKTFKICNVVTLMMRVFKIVYVFQNTYVVWRPCEYFSEYYVGSILCHGLYGLCLWHANSD